MEAAKCAAQRGGRWSRRSDSCDAHAVVCFCSPAVLGTLPFLAAFFIGFTRAFLAQRPSCQCEQTPDCQLPFLAAKINAPRPLDPKMLLQIREMRYGETKGIADDGFVVHLHFLLIRGAYMHGLINRRRQPVSQLVKRRNDEEIGIEDDNWSGGTERFWSPLFSKETSLAQRNSSCSVLSRHGAREIAKQNTKEKSVNSRK